jgi:hypothetical protein
MQGASVKGITVCSCCCRVRQASLSPLSGDFCNENIYTFHALSQFNIIDRELVLDCEMESTFFGTFSTGRLHTSHSTLAYRHYDTCVSIS